MELPARLGQAARPAPRSRSGSRTPLASRYTTAPWACVSSLSSMSSNVNRLPLVIGVFDRELVVADVQEERLGSRRGSGRGGRGGRGGSRRAAHLHVPLAQISRAPACRARARAASLLGKVFFRLRPSVPMRPHVTTWPFPFSAISQNLLLVALGQLEAHVATPRRPSHNLTAIQVPYPTCSDSTEPRLCRLPDNTSKGARCIAPGGT